MTLPQALRDGIDELVGLGDRRQVEAAARALSAAYRSDGPAASRAARTRAEVTAYLATRAPATFAAVSAALEWVRELRPDWEPTSALDLGAGPGIASWAAAEIWPGIARFALVEAEPEMIAAGRELARRATGALGRGTWVHGDAATGGGTADLVVSSYVLGELDRSRLDEVVLGAWSRCTDTFVVVEPGTTAGYRRALTARDAVMAAGGFTIAPCPHDAGCPLPRGDWCHFAARLPRTKAHRALKGAERGFEDEKLSYAALTRAPRPGAGARVIRRPELNPGHVVLTVCTAGGVERRTVTRSEKDAYRRARKLGWGDAL